MNHFPYIPDHANDSAKSPHPDRGGLSQKQNESSSRVQDWDSIFADWETSGLTITAFCRERGIKKHTFDYHRYKRNKQANPIGGKLLAVELTTNPTQTKHSSVEYQLSLPSGGRLSIPEHYNKETLQPLLKLLGVC